MLSPFPAELGVDRVLVGVQIQRRQVTVVVSVLAAVEVLVAAAHLEIGDDLAESNPANS